jgi:hypothetical protein
MFLGYLKFCGYSVFCWKICSMTLNVNEVMPLLATDRSMTTGRTDGLLFALWIHGMQRYVSNNQDFKHENKWFLICLACSSIAAWSLKFLLAVIINVFRLMCFTRISLSNPTADSAWRGLWYYVVQIVGCSLISWSYSSTQSLMVSLSLIPVALLVRILSEEKCGMSKLYFFLQLLTMFIVNNLSIWAQMCIDSEVHGKLQLCEYDDDAKIRRLFQINFMPGGYTFLTWKDTSDEVVLSLDMLLITCCLQLPRIWSKYIFICVFTVSKTVRFNTNDNRSILYKLSVVGPDDHSFKKAVSALHRIYAFFKDLFPEGVMWPHIWSAVGVRKPPQLQSMT